MIIRTIFSYFDSDISVYNFLQYSNKFWGFFSPELHFQNRLRHRDYLEFFQEAGFEVLEERRVDGTAVDLETIKGLLLDDCFKEYSPTELAIRGSHLILRKRDAGGILTESMA